MSARKSRGRGCARMRGRCESAHDDPSERRRGCPVLSPTVRVFRAALELLRSLALDYGVQGGGVNGLFGHELTGQGAVGQGCEDSGQRKNAAAARCRVSGPERSASVTKEAPQTEATALSFEQIVEQLSSVVAQLENGELPLEQALGRFEQGVALSRMGSKRLDEAERRIELLLRDARKVDGIDTQPFAEELKADE
jgi:exodeoxyribonuclease VII small subunit